MIKTMLSSRKNIAATLQLAAMIISTNSFTLDMYLIGNSRRGLELLAFAASDIVNV
jgi:hypothetical protein